MADQLYLSYWLNGFSANNMLRHYERLLSLFPYSRLTKAESVFQVIPLSLGEPSLVEMSLPNPVDLSVVLSAAKEFQSPDNSYRLETSWDLWQYDGDWEVCPAKVTLCCLGPQFDKDLGENLRIEFGIDTHFLPQPDLPNNALMTQSNIKSLLRLVHDLDIQLTVSRRQLWTESGDNFADKLQEALGSSTSH